MPLLSSFESWGRSPVLNSLFEALTVAVSGTPLIAVLASLAWGVLSVILSPCHLASIPLVVAFIGEQETINTRRALLLAVVFGSGILLTIGIIGVVTALLGRLLGDLGTYVNYVIAGVLVVIGLHFLGIIPIPLPSPAGRLRSRRGLLAAFIIGLVFGLAIGPCTFAFMAPMLAVALSAARTNALYSVMLLVAYGIGHTAVIVAAGTFTESVERYLKWTSRSSGVTVLRRICGVLIILAGIYMLWTA
jgi:cytochrome c-type biogenesis protein